MHISMQTEREMKQTQEKTAGTDADTDTDSATRIKNGSFWQFPPISFLPLSHSLSPLSLCSLSPSPPRSRKLALTYTLAPWRCLPLSTYSPRLSPNVRLFTLLYSASSASPSRFPLAASKAHSLPPCTHAHTHLFPRTTPKTTIRRPRTHRRAPHGTTSLVCPVVNSGTPLPPAVALGHGLEPTARYL